MTKVSQKIFQILKQVLIFGKPMLIPAIKYKGEHYKWKDKQNRRMQAKQIAKIDS